ncbi:unnamed protein product [Absidia cylindrospora]
MALGATGTWHRVEYSKILSRSLKSRLLALPQIAFLNQLENQNVKARMIGYFNKCLDSYLLEGAKEKVTTKMVTANYNTHGELAEVTASGILNKARQQQQQQQQQEEEEEEEEDGYDISGTPDSYHPTRKMNYRVTMYTIKRQMW